MPKILAALVFVLAVAVIGLPISNGFPWIAARFDAKYMPAEGDEEEEDEVEADGVGGNEAEGDETTGDAAESNEAEETVGEETVGEEPEAAGDITQLAQLTNDTRCFVCHDAASAGRRGWQKDRNDYGAALASILGDPRVLFERRREEEAQVIADIDAALDAIAGQDCGDGRTYGQILAAGQLPIPLPAGFGEDDEDNDDE